VRNLQKALVAVLLVASVVTAQAQAAKPAAETLLKAAQAKAKAEKKNVFVMFDASWCGWCKRLEKFMDDKEIKGLLQKNFVIVTIDVLEEPAKEALENPGGEAVLKTLHGENAGLPFTAILSSEGKLIVNSHEKPDKSSNIGYPAAANEIAHFMTMLKKGAPRLTDAERAKIKGWLEANAPK
jgi:thiol:disulfide interchange protein